MAAVLSNSPLMLSRVTAPLETYGFKTVGLSSVDEFAGYPRRRPFVVCFVDARGVNGHKCLSKCRKARPAERYVIIRDSWPGGVCHKEQADFGSICEAFSDDELVGWATLAAEEERRVQSAPPLEELLYERFEDFLLHIDKGQQFNLHQLVTERVERPLFEAVLKWSRGNQTKASKVLGLHRNTLRTKLKELGLSGRTGRSE